MPKMLAKTVGNSESTLQNSATKFEIRPGSTSRSEVVPSSIMIAESGSKGVYVQKSVSTCEIWAIKCACGPAAVAVQFNSSEETSGQEQAWISHPRIE